MSETSVHHAEAVFRAGVEAVQPSRLFEGPEMDRRMATLSVGPGCELRMAAIGKAALAMAAACLPLLPRKPDAAVAVVPYGYGGAHPVPEGVRVLEAGHPIPDSASERAAQRIQSLARGMRAGDVLLVLLSGGGSALVGAAIPPMDQAAYARLTRELIASGADIHAVNTVRRAVSRLAGGRLAAMAGPADVVTWAVSDVIGDRPEAIASGPTVDSPTGPVEAQRVLEELALSQGIPGALDAFGRRERLEAGVRAVVGSPRSDAGHRGARAFSVIGSNRTARHAAAKMAAKLGYAVHLERTPVEGEAREAGRRLAGVAAGLAPGECWIGGGETTVTAPGDGLGGRNQELALSAAIAWQANPSTPDLVLLSAGTDGRDGPTDAAGAVVTPRSISSLADEARDHLLRHDSHPFLDRIGALLRTGPTHTNVMDLQILIRPHL